MKVMTKIMIFVFITTFESSHVFDRSALQAYGGGSTGKGDI